jgi:geranylgeranyl diphosphate synthase type I
MSTSDVDAAIARSLAATASATAPAHPGSSDILEPLAHFATKGKRLRARLLLASHSAHGGTAHHTAVDVAAAVELFQTAALVHDDVLDSADTRRGDTTIHRSREAMHRRERWVGDSAHFGVSAAVLAGDLALMAANRAVGAAAASLGHEHGVRVVNLFADMAELCTAGQYLDMRVAAQPVESLPQQHADVMAVMRSKTASYTAEFPLALGAAVAGASDHAVAAMRAVGVPLGIAFQLRDDILGLVGAPEVTGKPAGDDIREGKRTVLMVHAWNRADAAARDVLSLAFGHADATAQQISEAVAIAVGLGAVEHAESQIRDLVSECRIALESAISAGEVHPGALAELEALITATTERAA